jgi:NADH-quinone oxidoreductase subunit H
MGLSAAGIFLLAGSFSLTEIVQWQSANPFHWGIVVQPVGFVLFLISLFAETGRAPFDVAEGESEIVAGYFVEYSAIRFALYYMGEYAHIAIASMLVSTLFLGGYQVPFLDAEALRANLGWVGGGLLLGFGAVVGLLSLKIRRWAGIYAKLKATDAADRAREYGVLSLATAVISGVLVVAGLAVALLVCTAPVSVVEGVTHWPLWVNGGAAVVQVGALLAKTVLICWVFVWVRWTLPRFRYDQIMSLGWKIMLNVALVNLVITALVAKLLKGGL